MKDLEFIIRAIEAAQARGVYTLQEVPQILQAIQKIAIQLQALEAPVVDEEEVSSKPDTSGLKRKK